MRKSHFTGTATRGKNYTWVPTLDEDYTRMISNDFQRQIDGFGLTTADILYRLPDHPAILQQYVWQDYDKAPEFPRLIKFLDFWSHNLDGPLASVRVAHCGIVSAREYQFVDHELRLH